MKCHEHGKNENSLDSATIQDTKGNVDHKEFECDDIKQVCNCNMQHNPHPQHENNNNHINQMENGNDSSHSDSKQDNKNF